MVAVVEHTDDVAMSEAGCGQRLATKARQHRRVRDQLGTRQLDRYRAIERALHRRIHDAHAADAEHLAEQITIGDELAAPGKRYRERELGLVDHDYAAGSSKKNREPMLGALSTPIVPPWASMIRFAT